MIQLYSVYKSLILDIWTHTGWRVKYGGKKTLPANSNPKRAEVAMLKQDKIDLKSNTVKKNMMRHII